MAVDRPEQFGGALCPVVTPFADGTVDTDALRALIDHLVESGIDGLVPCGTTGEFASLSTEEYRRVLETTVDAADGRVPVMAGTAATSVAETGENIELAADLGADAALVTLPYFHAANEPAGNETFLSAVADAAALPCYLYNIPSCVGTPISPETIASVAGHDSIVGLKDSGGDFTYFLDVAERTPDDFQLYQGFDSLVVWGMLAGATGGINALANVVPEAFSSLVSAIERGDVAAARDMQLHIAALFKQCAVHGFAPTTKAALVMRGVL
ncbi:MAG TPA: dihydrodipicolinate synthase family protein, partial [Halococcus sp.]|nr:dihydrodipicolinate synthase family protein [Halococcus sp.]